MIVRRLRDASLFSYVDSHSSSLHTGGSALSGIGAQHTEQCRCAATPEELVDRLLLPRSRAAVSIACEAVRVAALAILSFFSAQRYHSSSSVSTIVPWNDSPFYWQAFVLECSLPSSIQRVKLAFVASSTPIGSTTPEGPALVCSRRSHNSCNSL